MLKLAEENNPELIALERQLVEAQSSVAQAKAEKGLNANLTASYGLRDQDPMLEPGLYQTQTSSRLSGLASPCRYSTGARAAAGTRWHSRARS
ncbi:MAG: hypothetical protein MZV63_18695 [Marinilabiliales bacterium]|nr:hypothetical protein [Marinilabiliales bacterium]